MNNEKKLHLVTATLNIIVYVGVFVPVGQLFGMGYLDLKLAIPNIIIGAIIGYIVMLGVPLFKWGVALAMKLKARPGSFVFKLILYLVFIIPFVFLEAMGSNLVAMTLLGGVPAIISIMVAFSAMPLFIVVALIIAFIITEPFNKLARKICNMPEPEVSYN